MICLTIWCRDLWWLSRDHDVTPWRWSRHDVKGVACQPRQAALEASRSVPTTQRIDDENRKHYSSMNPR